MSSGVLLTFVCTAIAVFGPTSSVPMQQQQQQQQEEVATGGFSAVVWSVLDDCFGGEDAPESATVCLKSKALTALDRAISKPTVNIADGVSLAARTGKSMQFDQSTDKADWAALDAAKDSDQKNALLDDMLANRVDRLMSTKTIVMDSPADQEGRGKKGGKMKDKSMKKMMMMMGMMTAAVMGPMMMKMTALIALKALIAGKIALILSLIMLVKKLMSQKQGGGGGGGGGHSSSWENDSESSSYGSYRRSLEIDTHNMAFSGQKQ